MRTSAVFVSAVAIALVGCPRHFVAERSAVDGMRDTEWLIADEPETRVAPTSTTEHRANDLETEKASTDDSPRLSFDACFEKCIEHTDRSREECFDVCAAR
jgi:hypothetical protein